MNKASENRIRSLEVEAAFAAVFQKLGGAERFERWARQNPQECRRILSRFLPFEVLSDKGNKVTLEDLICGSRNSEPSLASRGVED